MKIDFLVKEKTIFTDNKKLKDFCKQFKGIKIGSLKCQECIYFENKNCSSPKNNKNI